MAIPVVDALFDAFGPFLLPAAVFAAGTVGYGVLLLAGRLLTSGTTAEAEDEAADTDRHQG
jgi:hypothetical protein